MRFDLLDEYSALVPFGLGVSRNKASQTPAVPAEAAERGTAAKLAGDTKVLHQLLGALRQMATLMPLLGNRLR
jgi:hypothetical protein